MLEPVLEHNLAHYKRLDRARNQVIIGGLLFLPVFAFLFPVRWIKATWVPFLIAFGVALSWIELRKLAVFRRDLREQREAQL